MTALHLLFLEPFPVMSNYFSGVMAGLVPAIHVLLAEGPQEGVDARHKAGHDGGECDSIGSE
jgi:hypothetical protein